MDIRKLQRAIIDGLEDVKAQNITVFNTEHLSPLFERVIVASGSSNRQTKALAASVRETVKQRGMPVLSTEGEDNGEWIIVDCGSAVVHVMQPAIREYYRLEEIWGDKPVRVKVATSKGLPAAAFASESADDDEAAAPSARKAGRTGSQASASTGSKARPKPTTPRTAGARTKSTKPGSASAGAGTSAAKRAPAKSTSPKTAVAKSVSSASAPSRKAAAKSGTGSAAAGRKTAPRAGAPRAVSKTVVVPRPRAAGARSAAGKTPARKAGSGGRKAS